MEVNETRIPGCFEIVPKRLEDSRGTFVKTLHQEVFAQKGLKNKFAEEYYSRSHHNVLRGLHFQIPPYAHVKIVYCVHGGIFDAIVDLRKGSPTFGQYETFEISEEKANVLYLPKGIAHGFYVLSQAAIVMYKVSTVYAPKHDTGILWNSAGIPWPADNPIMSERDKTFPQLKDFKSPFEFQG